MGDEQQAARILGSVETVICHRVNTPEEIVALAGTRQAMEYSSHFATEGATGEGSARVQHQFKVAAQQGSGAAGRARVCDQPRPRDADRCAAGAGSCRPHCRSRSNRGGVRWLSLSTYLRRRRSRGFLSRAQETVMTQLARVLRALRLPSIPTLALYAATLVAEVPVIFARMFLVVVARRRAAAPQRALDRERVGLRRTGADPHRLGDLRAAHAASAGAGGGGRTWAAASPPSASRSPTATRSGCCRHTPCCRCGSRGCGSSSTRPSPTPPCAATR